MNESDFENELRKLRPATPSRELQEGIARELSECIQTPAQHREHRAGTNDVRVSWVTLWLDRLFWSGIGAASAVLALMAFEKPQGTRAPEVAHQHPRSVSHEVVPLDASVLQPVLASEEDLGWRDEGVQFDPHGQPMLKLTRMAVERQAWADLTHAGVVQMEKPRQETVWVPVTLH